MVFSGIATLSPTDPTVPAHFLFMGIDGGIATYIANTPPAVNSYNVIIAYEIPLFVMPDNNQL
jgi:hypothetical protein